MLEVIEKDYVIDGQDVRVIFEPQEVVESDASDFSEDMDGLLGSYALFSIKNDQTVIGDADLFAYFNTDTGEKSFIDAGGIFLQDGWWAILMSPTPSYPAGSKELENAATTVLERYVAWKYDRLGRLEVISDDAFIEKQLFIWPEDDLTEEDIHGIMLEER